MAMLTRILTAASVSLLATQAADAQGELASPRARLDSVRPLALAAQLDTPFRPFPASADELTLRGELATSETAVFLSSTEALRATAFRVAFNNAVSNLPERSRLIVRINDQVVGDTSLNASGQLGKAIFAVPPGLLVPGYNSVRFTASQRHRVDCSVNATYELWTEIAPSQTGFVNIAPLPQPRRVAELPLLAGAASGPLPIRIRAGEGVSAATLDQAMRAVNALILAAGITRPRIEVASEPGSGPGFDLVIGETATAGRGAQLDPDLGFFLDSVGGGERTTLRLVDTPQVSIDTTIAKLEAFAALKLRPGSKAGQRAIANALGRRAGNDASFSFGELGMDPRGFDGNMLTMKSRMVLPADFFPAHYGAARLDLTSAFEGLANAAQRITIRVNDEIAAIVPIVKPGQSGFETRAISLPLTSFRPGSNWISLEANLADSQASCDVTQAPRSQSRLIVSPESRLNFGQIARVNAYPNLSATTGLGYPYAANGQPMPVGVSTEDPAFLDGALTFVGRMVASAQMPIATSLRFDPTDTAGVAGLFFGPPTRAPRAIELPLTPVASQSTTFGISTAMAQPPFPANAADTATLRDLLAAPSAEQPQPSFGTILRDGRDKLSALDLGASLGRLAKADFSGITAALADFGLLERRAAPLPSAFNNPEGALILRQTAQPGLSGSAGFFSSEQPVVQTYVMTTAPDHFVELIEKATSEHVWTRFNGDSAILRSDDWGPQNGFSQTRFYQASADVTPGNLRLVAAGWLSLNQGYYLAILAGLVVLLAVTTTAALKTRRG